MPNPGFIIVKDGDKSRRARYTDFYGALDKGAAKPSFCYPSRKRRLEEEIKKRKNSLSSGYVPKEREMESKLALKERENRLSQINQQEADAKKLFEDNKDGWMKRREMLAEEIAGETPSRESVKKRLINPHTTLRKEKNGGLEVKKKEYIILSRLAGEESNVTFLQKDRG